MEIVKSVSIENLINQRAAIMQRLEDAKRLYDEASSIAQQMGIDRLPSAVWLERGRQDLEIQRGNFLDGMSKAIDSAAWTMLMNDSGLRTFMCASAREEWDRQLRSGSVPALNAENVRNTFANLYGEREEMFERGVIECFQKLSLDYKTNSPCRFGKKIIMRFFGALGWSADYKACDKLDDLERVLHVMDGKQEPDHRDGWNRRLPMRVTEAESEYLQVRRFKNGNAHVVFLRLDLVEKLNAILAKHYPGALPARV